jgi:hypothetical protein
VIEDIQLRISGIELDMLKDYSDIEFDEMVKETLNPDMTVGDRLTLIRESDLSDEKKVIALNNLVNHLPAVCKESIDWDKFAKAVMKRSKKRVKQLQVAPLVAMSAELESVLSDFCNEKLSTVVENNVQRVFSELSGESLQEWSEKCSSLMGEEYAIMMCQKVVEFRKKHERYPSSHSNDEDERKLGHWLGCMRQAKQGKGSGHVFYPILDKMAEEAGYLEMFNKIDREQEAIDKCNKVIEFRKKHGRYPSCMSTDLYERKLGAWLSWMKGAKQGKGNGQIFYPILEKMVVDAGYPEMFNKIDLEQDAIDKCNKVIEFRKKHGHYPNQRSNDEDERKLGIWFVHIRIAKHGNETRSVFYPILEKMVVDAGYPELFNKIDREQEAIDNCNEVIEFKKKHGRYPSCKSKDEDERKLGQWLINMRRAKQGKRIRNIFYPILETMVKKVRLPNMFNSNWEDDLV